MSVRPWEQPAALQYVLDLLRNGARVCDCTAVSTLGTDGVFRCPECSGLDQGQVDDAQDHVPVFDPTVPLTPTVVDW